MWQGNIVALILNIVVWLVIGLMIYKIYSKQEEKSFRWKLIVALFFGIFSFSITLTFFKQPVQIAILPIGLWLLYGVLNRRRSWGKYRKYAWLGFFANYLFFASAIIGLFVHGALYPNKDIYTYLQDVSEAEIITIHPSGVKQIVFLPEAFALLDQFEFENFQSDEWYRETYEYDNEQRSERFPYVVKDSYSKWGSGYTPLVYLERDGKGLLITTDDAQFYFKSEQSLIGEVSAGE